MFNQKYASGWQTSEWDASSMMNQELDPVRVYIWYGNETRFECHIPKDLTGNIGFSVSPYSFLALNPGSNLRIE